jgi:FG-GAP-like repeat
MSSQSSVWLLAAALCGCGRVHHDNQAAPSDSGGGGSASDGGTAGGGGSAGAGLAGAGGGGSTGAALAGAGGEAGTPAVVNCLYPIDGLTLESRPNSGPAALRLSAPFPIDAPLGAWAGLSATYDVNGDLSSDLLYMSTQALRFHLLVTSPPPNVFDYREVDCPALASLPSGRLLLRDLDADGVPDFVIGVSGGLQIFLNRPDGVEQVLDYTFPPNSANSLLNAGVADLNGDHRPDLVVGYDRTTSPPIIAFELGVWSFLQQPDGSFQAGQSLVTAHAGGSPDPASPWQVGGYLAAGRFGSDDHGSVVMTGTNIILSSVPLGIRSQFDGKEPSILHAPVQTPALELFSLPKGDGHDYLLSVSVKTLDVLDLSQPQPQLVSSQALAFDGGISHELGGGSEQPRYFLYDIDGDGDEDFFERDPASARFALHLNLGKGMLDAAQVFELQLENQAERPFVRIGPGGGVVGQPDPRELGSAIYSLY